MFMILVETLQSLSRNTLTGTVIV